ncbi:MAG: hypothetical protein HC787_03670 [Nostocaceae cyanobacterium CSU_2_110]|nr:hypothetical protein [Nostocaceae cyanobacterium CSU_2_110]
MLAPVKDKLAKKRLVVVADGALQYIPFAALADLTAQPTSQQGKEEKINWITSQKIIEVVV